MSKRASHVSYSVAGMALIDGYSLFMPRARGDIVFDGAIVKADRMARPRSANPVRGGRRIGIFIYDGVMALDAVGPADVFGLANIMCRQEDPNAAQQYDVCLVGSRKVPIRTGTGFRIAADLSLKEADPAFDTLIVPGGYDQRDAEAVLAIPEVCAWLRRSARQSRRVASICTGAITLAKLGLLNGRRATTHWAFCDRLVADFPTVDVEPDNLWIKDGKIYTSAGITTGMDLAVALVEEDLGRRFALELARVLVMFLKRPGGQSQFSSELISQLAAPDRLEDLVEWVRDHLDRPLTVEDLAQRSGMSARNFQRVFTQQCGMPPGKFIERLRVERARVIIEDTSLSMAEIARKSGFDSEQRMRRSFKRVLAINPTDHAGRVRPASAGRAVPVPL
jgi:transcriptional regulator GlxA family with amidase domain